MKIAMRNKRGWRKHYEKPASRELVTIRILIRRCPDDNEAAAL